MSRGGDSVPLLTVTVALLRELVNEWNSSRTTAYCCYLIWRKKEKQLKQKRRWLMGIPKSSKAEGKQMKTPKLVKMGYLPESLLREDDVSYETVKSCVERAFGACTSGSEYHILEEGLQLFEKNVVPSKIVKTIFSLLDAMNNSGLYLLANMVTGGSVKFEKTCMKMKKVIGQYLPKILQNQNHNHQKRLLTMLTQLLKDPHNFQNNHATLGTPFSESCRTAVTDVLNELKDMPFQTLIAMHRRLKGIKGGLPQLKAPKSGWNRNRLIEQVTKKCKEMLAGEEMQGELSKAMAVACLSSKLTTGFQDPYAREFCHFSPETEVLQNEILKAISFLKEKARSSELKDIQLLLDPNAEFSNGCLRTAIRKMLIEYLFECSEMDKIPKSLLEALLIINRNSRSAPLALYSTTEKEDEFEYVLSVGCQAKQIVWDLFSNLELDQDFADAYMEDLVESDDDDSYDNNVCKVGLDTAEISKFHSTSSNDPVEETGESQFVDSISPTATTDGNGLPIFLSPDRTSNSSSIYGFDPVDINGQNSGDPNGYASSSSCQKSDYLLATQNKSINQYVAIQEVFDDTSVVIYKLIGRLLEEFAQIEGVDLGWTERSYLRGGDSILEDSPVVHEMQTCSREDKDGPVLIKVVEGLLPSFPKSGIDTLKELMGLQ